MLTDNNPLTYILMTPNLDALGHRWVTALAGYNITIKYLKGSDNKVADALSSIEARLDPDTITELLNNAKAGAPARAETDNIRIIEGKRGPTRRLSSRPSNWLARTRNSVISVPRTGAKLN